LSGPIAKQLDFNSGVGLMRVGRQANTSVGRFLRLLTRNIAGLRIPPGETDRAGIGNTFNVVMAEDEDAARETGWPTFGEERGVPAGTSAVTVRSVVGVTNPLGGLDDLVDVFGPMCGNWLFTGLHYGRWEPLILLNPTTAKELAIRQGMSKEDVRRYL